MKIKAEIIASVIITALLRSPVKSFALEHHTQFNAGVVGLLFFTVLAVIICVEFFGEFWKTCDAMAEEDEDDA